jgi:hypothetical protein
MSAAKEVLIMTVDEAIKVCNVLAFHGYGDYKLRTECGFVGLSCYPNCIDNDRKTINMEGRELYYDEDRGDLQMICDEISEVLSGGADNG